MNPNSAVIFDEAQFSKAIHKKIHLSSCQQTAHGNDMQHKRNADQ